MDLPRVLIIDGDPSRWRLLSQRLKDTGYEAPLEASTIAEAMEAVGRLNELKIEVVLLDASLEPGSFECDDVDKIHSAIMKTGAKVKVIMINAQAHSPYGDIQFPKPSDMGNLPERIPKPMLGRKK